MWPGSRDAIASVHLVENSSMMRSRQAQRLVTWREIERIPLYWWDSIEDVPPASGKMFLWLRMFRVNSTHPAQRRNLLWLLHMNSLMPCQ